MSLYSDNLWADAHGIDLDELHREHPLHPDQLRLRRIITRRATAYWARERFLARLGDGGVGSILDTPLDDDGKPMFPGVRSCGNNDCVNVAHVIGYEKG